MSNVIDLLEEHNIDFQVSGKNTTRGWVEVNCPFCPDPSKHLGINLSSYKFHCWQCGEKGHLQKLLTRLLGVSFQQAKTMIKDFSPEQLEEESSPAPIINIRMPKGVEKDFPFAHRQYLQNRGFDPDKLIEQYKLRACLVLGGEWSYRIIIPVIINNQIVSYTARDITGEAKSKYKHLSNEKSIVPIKQCLYNVDTVDKKILILEGVADVWRMGAGSVCLFGTEYTHHQLNFLHSLDLEEAYVMFDEGATKKAERLANVLTTFIPKVEVIEMDEGDPGELPEDEVKKLREEIGL